jgi:hypothetical protein
LGCASRYLLLGFVPLPNLLHPAIFLLSARPNKMAEDRTVPHFFNIILRKMKLPAKSGRGIKAD